MARIAPCRHEYQRHTRDRHERYRASRRSLGLVFLCLFLSACHSAQGKLEPSIEFSRVPPAAQGGRDRVDTISGRVIGARPGQRIVVYAKSGPWWVQPWPDQPFLTIQPDSTWSTSTHLGYEYAALLVDPGYQPPPTMDVTPTPGGSVVLASIVKGVGTLAALPTVPLRFSGYDWNVWTTDAVRGGVNNLYDADNVFTDADGALHMRISKKPKGWTCAHIILTRSLGYGTYSFVLRDTSHLEPAAVFSIHTFDPSGGEQHYREMDVEVSHWGDPASKQNAQYGIQPFYVPGNVAQFRVPAATVTHSLRWESGRASFQTVRGSSARPGAPLISEHTFTSGIPNPGQEFLEFMLYIVPSEKNPLQKGAEVVIEKFNYLP
jgi:hypothetical protein